MVAYFRRGFGWLAAICMLTPSFCVAEQPARWISFEAPDSTATYPTSINDLMVVTGYYTTTWGDTRGFVRYADGSITTFAVPGAVLTQPASINYAGDITGSYQVASPPEVHPGFSGSVPQGFVRAADGTITTFGNTPNGIGDIHYTYLNPSAINDVGEIVGSENDGGGPTFFTRSAAGTVEEFPGPGLSSNNQVGVSGLNASGAIIGFTIEDSQTAQGFLWLGGGTPPAPLSSSTNPIIVDGSVWTIPSSINAEGDIVGCYETSLHLLGFMRDQEHTITTLTLPGQLASCFLLINDAGTILSYYVNAANGYTPFVKPLHGEVFPFNYPGATMTEPRSLNNLDVITGYYSKGSTTPGFVLIPGNYEGLE